ncbi:hypothetical protein HY990_02340 [Candidatus Micrarchaeota archaeon]|nr:hypothetical protein [Candidatus Micrarchaeota archaeon]
MKDPFLRTVPLISFFLVTLLLILTFATSIRIPGLTMESLSEPFSNKYELLRNIFLSITIIDFLVLNFIFLPKAQNEIRSASLVIGLIQIVPICGYIYAVLIRNPWTYVPFALVTYLNYLYILRKVRVSALGKRSSELKSSIESKKND